MQADFALLAVNIPLWMLVRNKKGEDLEGAKEELISFLKLLEEQLGGKRYFNDETFGYVDIALVPLIACWFHTYETLGNFSIEEECPRLMDWVRRCTKRDSVSMALPDPHRVCELNCELRERLSLK